MNKKLKEILSTSMYLLIVLVSTFLVVTYVGQRTKVIGSSMEPMLMGGDNLIVDKISYRFQEPKRYDIIVFPFRYADKTYYIKRIIGLPGETVYIDSQGDIYIDGEILEESYGKEQILDPGRAYEPVVLGRTSILSWGITGTTVRTAATQWWETSTGMNLSGKPGCVSGLLTKLA